MTEKEKITRVLNKLENITEKSEIAPHTRSIIQLFRDTYGKDFVKPKTVNISLFDNFTNEQLAQSISEIRGECVRMRPVYNNYLIKINTIKPSLSFNRNINFI